MSLIPYQEAADIYFYRAQAILEAEDIDNTVVMEIFTRGEGILCGTKEVLRILSELNLDKIEYVPEGNKLQPNLPAMRITGRYLEFGIYETAILGILASQSAWATAAHECVKAASGIPVYSAGARHHHPFIANIMDYAAIEGGCVGASSIGSTKYTNMRAVGSMPHALMLNYGNTVEPARAFNKHMERSIPRIVLVDTFKDEVEEAIRIAQDLGTDLDGIRIDTPSERGGVRPALVREMRAKLDLAGFPDVDIYVSGGMTPERIAEFTTLRSNMEYMVKGFLVGSYISGRKPIDFTGDIKVVDGQPIAKRGRIPDITPNDMLVSYK